MVIKFTGTQRYNEHTGKLERKVDFHAKTTAPTIDDLHDAVKNGKLVASDNVRKLFNSCFKISADFPVEQFNFGRLTHAVIVDAQRDAIDFVEHKLFMPPYDICLYRCNIEYSNGIVAGTSLLNVMDDDRESMATILLCHSNNYLIAQHSVNTLSVGLPTPGSFTNRGEVLTNGTDKAVKLELPKDEYEFWRNTMRSLENNPPSPSDLCDGSMISMGLTMILNTKGVFKDRTSPPAKPNKVRAKQGRPLLPYVTHVRTAAYAQSTTEEHERGTHASPRPHRRRAHVRHYVRDGREWHTPIAAMLVNWDGSPLQRGQYDVDR